MSPFVRGKPNLLGSSSEGAGLNLLPMVQTSSLSAGPGCVSVGNRLEPLRLKGGASGSLTRSGRLERQSSGLSE